MLISLRASFVNARYTEFFFLPFYVTYVKTNLSGDFSRNFIERNFSRLHNEVYKTLTGSALRLDSMTRMKYIWKVGRGRGARQATPSAITNPNWLTKLNDKSV